MKVIVGLGNPGLEYYFTRHNAGFAAIDAIGRVITGTGANFGNKKNLFCDLCKVEVDKGEVLLVKPTTYMNESGKSVLAVLNWYKVELESLLVIHDDVSLPLGRIRIQKAGGAGGQHGIESIIEVFGGNKSFDRVKIGIGPDPGGHLRANYVLQNIPEADKPQFDRSLNTAAEAAISWVKNGAEQTANVYNGANLGQ